MQPKSPKKIVSLGIILFVCLLFVAQPFAAPFTLEDIMSYAFPSQLVASPSGDLIAWVFNQKGIRNIWIAEGPHYQPHQLTGYETDDGQAISSLAFNAGGDILYYVRGGEANREGEHPNPTSDPNGAEQEVWKIALDKSQPKLIGEGQNPIPSPQGNKLCYFLNGKLYFVDLDKRGSPSVLFRLSGTTSQAVWSPDGSKLVFVSFRRDHSLIGIYDFTSESVQWVSPSVDWDLYPVWSPCSKYVAFIRFKDRLFGNIGQTGVRFFILAAELSSGKTWEVWECPNATGGFSQYYPSQTLRWAADGNLVFYSEHEKWMHLYSFSLRNKQLTCLTPGSFEVENSYLSRDKKTVIFNSNAGDIDRRHLWKVSVSGGEAALLTPGKGIEWSPVLTAENNDLVFIRSSAQQPASLAVKKAGNHTIKLLAPNISPVEFPEEELIMPQQVIFQAEDGWQVHGQLFLPEDAKPGDGRSAVIFMHGGPIRQMLLGWHMRGYYHNAYAMNQYLAYRGYVVLSVNYRTGIGYGYDFRNAPHQGPRGASEYKDILAAALYLQERPEVDVTKIGLWGGSYGGYLTALGLARDSQLFAAGADLHGVHDWSLRARRRNGGGWGIEGEKDMELAFQSSPVADVEKWRSPVLFVHGDDDRNVDFIQTIDLVNRLRSLGSVTYELLIIPDEVHGFLRHKNWLKVYSAVVDFFDRHLKK